MREEQFKNPQSGKEETTKPQHLLNDKLKKIEEKIVSEEEAMKALTRVRSESEKTEPEMEKIEEEFVKELKETPKREFYKKLKRIIGAFILAGLYNLYPEHKALTPELSPELKAIQSVKKEIEEINERSPEMCQRVLKYLQKKGGVPLSQDLPTTIYKQ